MKSFFLKSAIFSLFCIYFIEARKKKQEVKAKVPKKSPKDLRPSYIDEQLYCEGCVVAVTESQKKLFGKKSESDVTAVVENICTQEQYNTYSKRNI